MKRVQDSLVDYFSEQGGAMSEKMKDIRKGYSCEKESKKVSTHVPSL